MTLGADGALYGTARHGGAFGLGVVFRVTVDGTFTVLHSFDGSDGTLPRSSLVQARDGWFYGVTESGEAFGQDVVYKVAADGTFTVLHRFAFVDGLYPASGLAEGSDGGIYGMTTDGGPGGGGVVFRLAPADTIAPRIVAAPQSAPGPQGWYTTDVIVSFTCTDDSAGSGIPINACPADQVLSGEGPAVSSTPHTVTDAAGNISAPSNVVTVQIDKTRPTITAVVTSVPNAFGWYRNDVVVRFVCADAGGSGVAPSSCPLDQVLSSEGVEVASAAYTVTDVAGNVSLPSNVIVVKIDKTGPMMNPRVTPDPVWLGDAALATPGAFDPLSGLVAEFCDLATTDSVGLQAIICTATDAAGNTASRSVTHQVIYRFDGFFQPVNDSGRATCPSCPQSVFRSGSTVSLRFQLRDAAGTIVQSANPPTFIEPVRLGPSSAAVNEDDSLEGATPGTSYRWIGQRYRYDWSTIGVTNRSIWRVGVRLEDGQTYVVDVGVR